VTGQREHEAQAYDVEVLTTVRVTVNDPGVIERITGPDGDEWREQMYPLHSRDDVLAMLADNCARRGVERVNRLDGWADLPDDAATMESIGFSSLEGVLEAKP
jgi:hypothetical protein